MKVFNITFNGHTYEVEVEEKIRSAAGATKTVNANPTVSDPAPAKQFEPRRSVVASTAPAGGQVINTPMPGKIQAINVSVGDRVKNGDVLLPIY